MLFSGVMINEILGRLIHSSMRAILWKKFPYIRVKKYCIPRLNFRFFPFVNLRDCVSSSGFALARNTNPQVDGGKKS